MFDAPEGEIACVWIDFESNGTDIRESRIIEAGVIATGTDLDNEFFTMNTMIIDGDIDEVIKTIEENPFLANMHGENGLLADLHRVRAGELPAMTISEFDAELYRLVKQHNASGSKMVIAGSGVAHYDALIVKDRMPLTESLFIYHSRDIGHTRREYFAAVGHDLIDVNDHKNHRAFDDITDHLNETRAFRDFFRKATLALEITGIE